MSGECRVKPESRRACAAAALAACLTAIAGCGGSVIDDAKAEDAIEADVERNLGVEVAAVGCPEDVDVEAGRTFSCVVTTEDGKRARATLRIVNSDADVNFVDLKRIK